MRKPVSTVSFLSVTLVIAALGGMLPKLANAQSVTSAAALDACLDRLRPQAPQHRLSVADFDRYTAQASLLEATVSAARSQPEQRITWWDYLARVVDQERVDEGRALLTEQAEALHRVAERFQVDPAVVVAIFGVETNYGQQMGSTPVLDAWLTRACTENRPLWISNVYASIRLLRDGVVDPDEFHGSWSGAFGMTQFIPTSFYELAVDGDGDGVIDLYGSLPDALASAANHLRARGARWQTGVPAVIEVQLPAAERQRLPADSEREIFQRERSLSLGQWQQRGVQIQSDTSSWPGLSDDVAARLFVPTGANGPAFLVTRNFDALLQYNQSTRYALAVGLLANQVGGDTGLRAPWPTEDPGLSRAEVREMQRLLTALGHDIGAADGIPGARTRAALATELHGDADRPVRVGRHSLDQLRSRQYATEPAP